jgi:hypothetical protein
VEDRNERIKWALRRLYYRQRRYRDANGAYASNLEALRASEVRVDGAEFRPVLHTNGSSYEISAAGFDGSVVRITDDGRVWLTR